MSETPLSLTTQQISQLINDTSNGTNNFVEGYNDIVTFIQQAIDNNTNTLGSDSVYWYQQAPGINGNSSTSSANTYIRTASGYGLAWDGISNSNLQATSDSIAENVIKQVILDGSLPTVNTLLAADISAALEDGNQTIGGWGGAFYYWNSPYENSTVGSLIEANPSEYQKFVAANAAALIASGGQSLNTIKSASGLVAQLTTLFSTLWNNVIVGPFVSAQAPLNVKGDIISRAVSTVVFGTSVAGDPNAISGYIYLGQNANGSGIWGLNSPTMSDVPSLSMASTAEGQQLDTLRQLILNQQNTSYPPSGIGNDEDDDDLDDGVGGPTIVPPNSGGGGGGASPGQTGVITSNSDGSVTVAQGGLTNNGQAGVASIDVYAAPGNTSGDVDYLFNSAGNMTKEVVSANNQELALFTSNNPAASASPLASVNPNGSLTSSVSGLTISLVGPTSLNVTVSGNAISDVSSSDNIVTVSGSSVAYGSSVSGENLTGNNISLTLASNDQVALYGTGISAGPSAANVSGDTLLLENGSSGAAGVSNGTVDLAAGSNNDSWTVSGQSNTVNVGGSADSLATSGNTVNYANNDGGDVLSGNGDSVTFGQNVGLALDGTGLSVNGNSGANISLGNGSSGTVSASSDTFSMVAGSNGDSWTLSGQSDTVNIGGSTDSLATSGNTVNYQNNDSGDTLSGNGDSVTFGQNVGLALDGTGLSVNGNSGASVSFGNGSSGTVSASSDTFSMVAGSNGDSWTLSGQSDTVNIGGSTDSLATSGNTVNYQNNDSGDTLSGNGDSVTFGQNVGLALDGTGLSVDGNSGAGVSFGNGSSGTVSASSDTFTMAAGSNGDSWTLSGQSDTVNIGGSTDSLAASGTTVNYATNDGGDLLLGDNDSVTFGKNVGLALCGTGLSVSGNSGATITLDDGSGTLSASDDSMNVAAGTTGENWNISGTSNDVQITGSNNTIAAANGNSVYIESGASADVLDGSDENIGMGADASFTVNGTGEGLASNDTGDTVTLGSNSSGTSSASGSTFEMASGTTGSNWDFTGTGNTIADAGSSELITTAGDNQIYYGGNLSCGNFTGTSGDDVTLGSEDALGVYGSGLNIAAGASGASGDYVVLFANSSGNDSTSNGTFELSNGSWGLTGQDNTLGLGSNANVVAGSGDAAYYAANSTGDNFTGTGDTLELGSDDAIGVNGSGLSISTASGASGDTTYLGNGSSGSDSSSSGTFFMNAGSNNDSWTLSGQSDTVNIGGSTDSLATSGNTVNYANNDGGDTLSGNNDSVTFGQNVGLTLDGTGLSVNGNSGANISLGNGSSGTVSASSDTFTMAAGSNNDSWTVSGQSNTVNVGGSADNLATNGNTVNYANNDGGDTFSGNKDSVTFGLDVVLALDGTGLSVNGNSGANISLGNGSSGTVSSSSDTFSMAAGSNGDNWNLKGEYNTVTVAGSNDELATNGNTVNYANNDTGDTLSGGNDTVYLGSGLSNTTINGAGNTLDMSSASNNSSISLGTSGETAAIGGSDDHVNASAGDTLSYGNGVSGNVISGSGITIDLGNNESITATGNDDKFVGGSSNNLIIDGSGDSVTTNSSTIDWTGGDDDSYGGSGDHVEDSSDPGWDGDANPPPPPPPSPSPSPSMGIAASVTNQVNMVGQYDLTHGLSALKADKAWSTAQAAIAAGDNQQISVTPSTLNGGHWAVNTPITWSFAQSAPANTILFGGSIQAQYQSAVEKAMAVWAQASGLDLTQVTSFASADIEIGWGNLNSSANGVVGLTQFETSDGRFTPGTSIELENPALDAITSSANGALTYGGLGVQLEQVALHEVGHALGLGESSDPDSIMFPELSSQNIGLDASDYTNIRALYSLYEPSGTVNGPSVMTQAMAAFNSAVSSTTSTMQSAEAAGNTENYILSPHV